MILQPKVLAGQWLFCCGMGIHTLYLFLKFVYDILQLVLQPDLACLDLSQAIQRDFQYFPYCEIERNKFNSLGGIAVK